MNHSFIFKYSYYFSNIQPGGQEARSPESLDAEKAPFRLQFSAFQPYRLIASRPFC
jgi:hypothetical protein